MSTPFWSTIERDGPRCRYVTESRHVLDPVVDRLRHSSDIGYLHGRETHRFRDAGAGAAAVAEAITRADLPPGEPVGLIGPPSIEWVAAAFGILASGTALAPIDHNLTGSELTRLMDRTGIRHHVEIPGGPRLGSGAIAPDGPGDATALELHGGDDDLAVVLHTSGTSGVPKAVELTHTNLVQSLCSFIDVFECTGEDRTCIAVPLFHVTGLLDQFLQMAWLGGRCRLLDRFSTRALLESLTADGVTVMFAVPTVFALLVREPPPDPLALRLAIYGGSPIGQQTVRSLLDLVPGIRPVQGYGMTEMSSLATALPFDDVLVAPQSVGVPSPITELRVVDESGRECAPDAIGEILMRGPHLMRGYRGDPEATAAAVDDDGWLHSGDLAWRDERGLLHLAGRRSEIINRGGEKISPREIEGVLSGIDGVHEAVAFAVPDEIMYELPAAAVVVDPAQAPSEDTVAAAVERDLAGFKHPVSILRLPAIPLAANGKPDIRALRSQVWAQLGIDSTTDRRST